LENSVFEVQMLVPVTDNDGKDFSDEIVAEFESAILDRFGGFTLLPSEVSGEWRNDAGVRYRDRSRCYLIGIDSIGRGSDVVELAHVAKKLFAQEAIAVRYLGQLEIL
jgi:hypothetical protein